MDVTNERELLDKMLECDPVCGDLSCRNTQLGTQTVEWMMDHLPAYRYVLDRTLNYMFSNDLTTGDDQQNEILDKWLYETKNIRGVTNYAEIKDSIGKAISYGESALRAYNGNIYAYKRGYYGTLVRNTDGIEEEVAYFIHKNGNKVEERINTDDWGAFRTYGDILNWFGERGFILLDKTEFLPIRNETVASDGESPLFSDKERVSLILAAYDQLNYDIRYDGPGRTFFFTKGGYISGEENDISTGEVLMNTPASRELRLKKAQEEIEKLMKEVKNSSSDSVGVLSGSLFDEKPLHLPRVTKATEFLTWLQAQDTLIVAELIGMSPTLLELGKMHGNISVDSIIDNAMLNNIIPMREMYATQFSGFISDIIGVSKIYFNKYDMRQIEDENAGRQKLAVVIKNLSDSYATQGRDEVGELIDVVAKFMKESFYSENGDMKKF